MRWVALAACALALAACGEGEDELTVSAAASLRTALSDHAPEARFSFAGSDELAAQIRQGVKPDVYAAANTELPGELFEEGLVERPVAFARNRLVLAVPAGSGIRALEAIAGDGVSLAIGAEAVPVGSYTRTVLERLPARRRQAILANVRSEEPDVAGIVGKLTQGAVDAGFVYVSDVRATGGALEAIELPEHLQPGVTYAAAVVRGARNPQAAREFVRELPGARALLDAGFEAPT